MAQDLSGSGSFIDLSNATDLNPAAMTFACWVNIDTFAAAYNAVVMRFHGSAYYGHYVKNDGKTAVYLNTGVGTPSYDGIGNATVSTGADTHISFSYDSSAGLASYVNGIADGTAAASGAFSAQTAVTYIGNDANTAGRNLDGRVWEAGIWNVVLDAAEMAALAKGFAPSLIRPQSLVLYTPLVRTIIDIKGGHTASGTNASVFPHGRVINSRSGMNRRFTTAAGGGGGFQAAWAANSNVIIQHGSRAA